MGYKNESELSFRICYIVFESGAANPCDDGGAGQPLGLCPNCGSVLSYFENNKPVANPYCGNCSEEYELSSRKI